MDGVENILIGYTGNELNLIMPTHITKINESAFSECKDIQSVVINRNTTSIGCYAFSACTSLISVVINEGVTDIGYYAFTGCVNLSKVEMPESLTSIGYHLFYECTSLQYNTEGDLEYLGNNSNPYLYLASASSTSVKKAIINSNCKFIGDSAFFNCVDLVEVEIPNGVTIIGQQAFFYCEGLTEICIPITVTVIGEYAFNGCFSLTIKYSGDSIPSTWNHNWNANGGKLEFI